VCALRTGIVNRTERFRTATAPGSEFLFPFEVVHLARSRPGSAATSKGLFLRCIESLSRYGPLRSIRRSYLADILSLRWFQLTVEEQLGLVHLHSTLLRDGMVVMNKIHDFISNQTQNRNWSWQRRIISLNLQP